eukprot:390099-Rhodomonas_salina.1
MPSRQLLHWAMRLFFWFHGSSPVALPPLPVGLVTNPSDSAFSSIDGLQMGVSPRRMVSTLLFRVHVAVIVSVAWLHASQTEADVGRVLCRRTILASTRWHWPCR